MCRGDAQSVAVIPARATRAAAAVDEALADPAARRPGHGAPGHLRCHRRPAQRPHRCPSPATRDDRAPPPRYPGMIPLTVAEVKHLLAAALTDLGSEAEQGLQHRQGHQLGIAELRANAHGRPHRRELRRFLQQVVVSHLQRSASRGLPSGAPWVVASSRVRRASRSPAGPPQELQESRRQRACACTPPLASRTLHRLASAPPR